MEKGRKVKLFRNGQSQALRIPKELELPGTEAFVRREDGALIIEPVDRGSLLETLDRLEPLNEDLPDVDDTPAEPVDL